MKHPKVSVCLPTLNARRFLPERMESILQQTEHDWELIVCDSYSEDGTWEYLQKFSSDPRIHLFQVPQEGLYAGWNECLARAKGEYIYIATADDTMEANCLEVMQAALDQSPDVDIALSETSRIDELGNTIETRQPDIWGLLSPNPSQVERIPGLTFFILLCGFASGFGSVTGLLLRRRLFEKTGPFPTDLWFLGDCEWALKAVLHSDVMVLPNKVATWRSHGNQASSAWNLRAACLFLRSLDRVLQQDHEKIPASWKTIPQWKARLLLARQIEAELATKLCLEGLLRSPKLFLCWIVQAARHAPRMLLKRFLYGFRLTARHSINATSHTVKLLAEFGQSWPDQRCLLPHPKPPKVTILPRGEV